MLGWIVDSSFVVLTPHVLCWSFLLWASICVNTCTFVDVPKICGYPQLSGKQKSSADRNERFLVMHHQLNILNTALMCACVYRENLLLSFYLYPSVLFLFHKNVWQYLISANKHKKLNGHLHHQLQLQLAYIKTCLSRALVWLLASMYEELCNLLSIFFLCPKLKGGFLHWVWWVMSFKSFCN